VAVVRQLGGTKGGSRRGRGDGAWRRARTPDRRWAVSRCVSRRLARAALAHEAFFVWHSCGSSEEQKGGSRRGRGDGAWRRAVRWAARTADCRWAASRRVSRRLARAGRHIREAAISWDNRGRSGAERGGVGQLVTPPVSFETVATLPLALYLGILKIAAQRRPYRFRA